ncbi:MAG TPA: RHS repeat-associated core domain-containing protein, partial [Bryobacteraceae bacterium]|nr:RHS repeat-associated core domain-containing protein [Bryobacteraceae bacterium]
GMAPPSFTPRSSGWYNAANNRLTNTGLGIQHDAVGNLTAMGAYTFTYNADGLMRSSTVSGTTRAYGYDGEGHRVRVGTTTYVYDASGSLAAEYGGTPGAAGTQYMVADMLGSTRLVLDNAGPVRRYDYYPFGEAILAGVNGRTTAAGHEALESAAGPRQRFTGKERDIELATSAMPSGLDYFESRYFSSAQGRFTTPDVMMGKTEWLVDPQRWNRYAYVRNNPLRYIDPNGEDLVVYTFYGSDLTDEQKKYLQANMKQIQASIAQKFRDAGVEKVDFRDGSTLTQKQISKILENGRSTNTTGIGLLNFSNEKFGGYQSKEGVFGATASDTRSATFMKQIGEGLDLSRPGDAAIMNFRIGEVGAHELGHGQNFESDMAPINFIKQVFGGGNLMGEGQGMPTRPSGLTLRRIEHNERFEKSIGSETTRPSRDRGEEWANC